MNCCSRIIYWTCLLCGVGKTFVKVAKLTLTILEVRLNLNDSVSSLIYFGLQRYNKKWKKWLVVYFIPNLSSTVQQPNQYSNPDKQEVKYRFIEETSTYLFMSFCIETMWSMHNRFATIVANRWYECRTAQRKTITLIKCINKWTGQTGLKSLFTVCRNHRHHEHTFRKKTHFASKACVWFVFSCDCHGKIHKRFRSIHQLTPGCFNDQSDQLRQDDEMCI